MYDFCAECEIHTYAKWNDALLRLGEAGVRILGSTSKVVGQLHLKSDAGGTLRDIMHTDNEMIAAVIQALIDYPTSQAHPGSTPLP
jgi:hypothetical protein